MEVHVPTFSCVVCERKAHSLNYAVISCRACAKFFHRTHSLHKYYICRKGAGQCDVRKDVACVCRKCRIDKCLAVGMRLTRPQKSKKSERLPGDDGENLTSPSKIIQSRTLSSSSSDDKLPSLYLYKEEDSEGLLSWVVTQFCICFEKRRRIELQLWATSCYGEECVIAPSGESFYVSTEQFVSDFFVSVLEEFRRAYITTFMDFRMLTKMEQESMIAATGGSVYVLETSYLTVKHFANSDRYSFISPTTIFDNESCGSFVPSIDEDREALIRTMKFYSDKMDSLMLPTLRDAKLTEIEYHAAMCLIFWNFDFAPWISQTVVEAGQKIKKKLYTELSNYYKNVLKCEDIAVRMGRLMTVVHSAQEAGVLLQEEMQMYKLMGVFKHEDMLLKFFLST